MGRPCVYSFTGINPTARPERRQETAEIRSPRAAVNGVWQINTV
ncbi:MAG: hypothetical protein WBV94_15515 [Blastocatellia bacterium]